LRQPYYIRRFCGGLWRGESMMVISHINRKHHRNLLFGLCLVLALVISIGATAPFPAEANTQEEPIKILFVIDFDFGLNYGPIRTIFERFGWDITTTALNKTLTSCDYASNYELTVDVLLTEISDVTEYDILTIIPGESHASLLANDTALDLIRDAVSQNLVVTAWCRAVRVLATADVIDGKNVTGHVDYQAEYEAAGATFFESSPPITDGNIITSVRSNFYRDETCNAIAAAVGFYESNAPTMTSASISPSPTDVDTDPVLTATISDETFIYIVTCKIYKLNITGGRPATHTFHLELNETSIESQFQCVIEYLEVGNYTVDLMVWDCFMNYAEFTDVVQFTVLEELPTSDTTQGQDLMQYLVPGSVVGGIGVVLVIAIILIKKR
jgi:putative intracellular protease/amidase